MMPDTVITIPPILSKEVYSQSALSEVVDWGLKMVGVPDAWKVTKGKGVVVGIADTGIDTKHPDLVGNILEAKDFSGSRLGPEDVAGHGSHVAGTVAASDNDSGVIGVAPHAKLVIAKVLGDSGQGMGSWVARGIDWLLSKNVDIISMSLGSPDPDSEIMAAVQRAVVAGKFVICAAGNDGNRGGVNSINYPARWGITVTVGAVDKQGNVCDFSSRGPEVDIAAPGQDILSCWPKSKYARLSGTSMATPLVSGVTALMVARHRELGESTKTPLNNTSELKDHLKRTASGDGKRNSDKGWGIIDPNKMLAEEQSVAPGPPSSPPPSPPGSLPVPPKVTPSFVIPNVLLDGKAGKLIWVAK